VYVHPRRVSNCEERFRHTFTKIETLGMTEYEKIVVIDIDTLVLRGCGELFAMEAPAAMQRGQKDWGSSRRHAATLFDQNGDRKGGINAGVMVLHPNDRDRARSKAQLRMPGPARTAPEQDYFTELYMHNPGWRSLNPKYNWQPKQMHYLFLRYPIQEKCPRRIKLDDIHIAHFSGTLGPHDYLFADDYFSWCLWFDEVLLPHYGDMYEQDSAVVKQVCMKWYETYENAWKDIQIQVMGDRDSRDGCCPCCGQADFLEHTFFECETVQDLQYAMRCFHYKSIIGKREALMHPKHFKEVFRFIDEVYQRRSPGLLAPRIAPQPTTWLSRASVDFARRDT